MSNTFDSKLAHRWNWGAFLLGPVWALVHQVWFGLIAWLPHLMIILNMIARFLFPIVEPCVFNIEDPCVVSVTYFLFNVSYVIGTNVSTALVVYSVWYLLIVSILGIKGNKWALKAGEINDLKKFNLHQKIFSIIGLLFGLPLFYINIMCLDFLIRFSIAG
jgi:hypothetical protein